VFLPAPVYTAAALQNNSAQIYFAAFDECEPTIPKETRTIFFKKQVKPL